ncbi:hypothetical protein OHS18_09715 [Amycolatopsis sp. NBC_00355]|uniref:hypothetical protein n=1 Tax=Amycolatopsis sp. NBC_00355 TaxID=2975957 RepID=UPI002E257072
METKPSDDGGAPGVPGSPIDYDSTLALASPAAAKESILDEVGRLCDGGCGIEVVIRGSGECSPEIGPDPVARGGTITIVAGPCPGPPTEPSTSDEPSAAGTSTTTTG